MQVIDWCSRVTDASDPEKEGFCESGRSVYMCVCGPGLGRTKKRLLSTPPGPPSPVFLPYRLAF